MASISVIVPTYNRTKYLMEAVTSVLEQSVPVKEIIIVDDGSDGQYAEELNQVAALSDKIKLITNSKNHGVAYSRNKGVEYSKGQYITFLDDDDTLNEGFFKKMIDELEHDENPDAVMCQTRVHKDGNAPQRAYKLDKLLVNREESFHDLDVSSASYFLTFCPMVHSFVFKRSVFDNLRFPVDLSYGEDMFMWLSLVNRGLKIRKINWVGSYVRVHSEAPAYSFEQRDLFHKILTDARILDEDGENLQGIRYLLFLLINGKMPSLSLLRLALERPGRLAKFAWFHLRHRF